MICNNKKQVFMGGSPKAKSTDFTPAFFLLQDVFLYIIYRNQTYRFEFCIYRNSWCLQHLKRLQSRLLF